MSKQQTKQDTAVPRFTSAARRIRAGIVQQKRRLDERQSSTKRMHVGAHEVLDFSDDEGLDLDYYAYELVRLQTLTEVTIKVFKQPQALIDALDDFKTALPYLKEVRNPLTHPANTDELDNVVFFGALEKLEPGGRVRYLVDPRYNHHCAALKLADELLNYLRGYLKQSIEADPPLPLKDQIAERNKQVP